jgi:tetratricopeptide (TPR) repeat protein
MIQISNRAAAFLQLGKEIKAIKDAEQAIALKPDWAKGYFRKGGALVALRKYDHRGFSHTFIYQYFAEPRGFHRWDEAIEVLKKALELEPKSKEISAMLRDTMRKSKRSVACCFEVFFSPCFVVQFSVNLLFRDF